MKKLVRTLTSLCALLSLSNVAYCQLVDQNLFLQANHLEAGVAPNGAFGTVTNSPIGYHSNSPLATSGPSMIITIWDTLVYNLAFVADPSYSGWINEYGDYTIPVNSQEGWAIQVGSDLGTAYDANYISDTGGLSGGFTGSLTGTNTSYSSGSAASGVWQGTTDSGKLAITQTYSLDTNRLFVNITVTLRNTTSAPLNNIYYMREVAAHNDYMQSGDPNTYDSVEQQLPNPNNAVVVSAAGLAYDSAYMALGTRDCRARAFISPFAELPTDSLNVIYNETGSEIYTGAASGDEGMGLVYNIGTLAPMDSTSFTYSYMFLPGQIDTAISAPTTAAAATMNVSGLTFATSDTVSFCASTGDTIHPFISGGAGSTWRWTPTTYLADSTDTTNIISVTGLTTPLTYTITGTNACGTQTFSLTLNPSITPKPTATSPIGYCVGATASALTATGAALTWYTAPVGGTGSPVAPTPSTASGGVTNYYVSQTIGSCESARDTIQVFVTSPGTLSITSSGPDSFCIGDSVKLSVPALSGYTFQWYDSHAMVPGATNHSFAATASSSYYVIVKSSGCADTTATVNVHSSAPAHTIAAAGGPSTICPGDSVRLTEVTTGAGHSYTFQWHNGATTIPGATDTFYVAHDTGAYTVYTNNGEGCVTVSDSVGVSFKTISPSPVASSPVNYCLGGIASPLMATGTALLWYTVPVGGSGSAIPPTPSTSTVGTTDYYVSQTTGGDCESPRDTIAVNVSSLSGIAITSSGADTFCTGDSVILSVPSSSGYFYQWFNGAVLIGGATGNAYTAFTPGDYAAVISETGCTDTTSAVAVSIATIPVASITPTGSTTFCPGDSVHLLATSGTGFSYQWYRNGATIPGASDSAYTATIAGNYTVRLFNAGCGDSSLPITIALDTVASTAVTVTGSTTFCAGSSVVLHAATGSGTGYQWFVDGTLIVGATLPFYVADSGGTYLAALTTLAGCVDTSAATTLTETAAPSTAISHSGSLTFCSGDSVVLSATADTAYSYQWLNGALAIPGATDAHYTATTTGSYRVVVSTGTSCSDTTSAPILVTVNPTPVAVITHTGATVICSGGSTVTLKATATPGTSYYWYKNDTLLSLPTSDTTYATTTTGSFKLAEVSSVGCVDTSTVVTVTADSLPVNVITALGPTSFCLGKSVKLQADTGSGYTYEWIKNTGTHYSVVGDSATITASSSGYYFVIITTACGSFDTSAYLLVASHSLPVASDSVLGDAPTRFCQFDSVKLIASAHAGYTYQWLKNDSAIAGATTSSLVVMTSGDYKIVTNNSGCPDTSLGTTITVLPLPPATITPSGATAVCTGDTVTLNADTSSIYTYQWYSGSTVLADTSASYGAFTSGTYSLIVTDSSHCKDTASISISVTVPPVATVSATGVTTFCFGDSVVLSSSTGAGYTYQWLDSTVAIPGATDSLYAAYNSGSYRVVVTNSSGCGDTSTATAVIAHPLSGASITASGPTTFCPGNSVVLKSNTGAGYSYQWYDNDTLITGATDSTYTTDTTGSYYVKVTTSFGCTDSSSTASVIQTAPPSSTVLAFSSLTFCQNDSVVLQGDTGVGYTYQWLQNGSAIPGATNIDYTATTTANYVLVVSIGTGCTDTSSPYTVTVNPNPGSTITGASANIVCRGNSVTIHANPGSAAYYWYYNDTLLIAYSGGMDSVITVNPSWTTGFMVEELNSFGCTDTSTWYTIYTDSIHAVIAAGDSTFACAGSPVTLVTTPGIGNHYVWQSGSVTLADTASLLVTDTSGTYVSIVKDTLGCSDTSAATTVTINPLPLVTPIFGTTAICVGNTSVLSDTTFGGIWASDDSTIASVNSSGVVTAMSNGTTIIRYSVTNSFGCIDSSVILFTSDTLPVVTPVSGLPSLCVLDTTTVSDATPGGVWHSNDPSLATIDSLTGLVTGVGSGVVHLSYVVRNGAGCQDSAILFMTINPLPVIPSIAGDTNLCLGSTGSLTDSILSGMWQSDNVTVASVNPVTGAIAGLSAGTTVVVYQYVSPLGCRDSVKAIVTVDTLPVVPAITGATSVCPGIATSLSDSVPGGVWSSYDTSIFKIDSTTGIAIGGVSGSATVKYKFTDAHGCTDSSTTLLTVYTLPFVAPISGITALCATDTTTLYDATGGGTWHTDSSGIATINPTTGFIRAVAGGNTNVVYTVVSGVGCVDSSVIPFTVNAPPVLTAITGSPIVCIHTYDTLYESTAGGIWISDDTSIATVNSSGFVYAVASGTVAIVYQISNIYGCTDSVKDTVTVRQLPAVGPITGVPPYICNGASATLSDSVAGGRWSSGDTTSVVFGVTPGVAYSHGSGGAAVYYTVIDVYGCEYTVEAMLFVNALPNDTLLPGYVENVCQSNSLTIHAPNVSGYTYQWYDSTSVLTGSTDSMITVTTSGYYAVAITDSNGCKDTSAFDTVYYHPMAPRADSLSGSPGVCLHDSVTIFAATGAGYTYQWIDSGVIIPGATNSSYTDSLSGTYAAIITTSFGCVDTSSPVLITINPLPVAYISPSGFYPICEGQSVTFYADAGDTATAGYHYDWVNAGKDTSLGVYTDSINITAGVGSFNYGVLVTDSNGCKKYAIPTLLYVNDTPAASLTESGPLTFCDGDSVLLHVTVQPSASYAWYHDGTLVSSGSHDTNLTAKTSGNYYYVIVNGIGCKSTSNTDTVVVNPLPPAAITPAGPTTFCPGGSVTLNANTGAGLTYQWNNGGTPIPGATNASYVTDTTGNYTVTEYTAFGCTATSAAVATLDNIVTATITPSGPTTFCAGNNVTLSATAGVGLTYQWLSTGHVLTGVTSSAITSDTTGDFAVIVTNATGCVDTSAYQLVIVNGKASGVVVTSGPTLFCVGGSVTLTTPTVASYTYQWYDTSGPIPGATSPSYTVSSGIDTYSVVVTTSAGCADTSMSVPVTVDSVPVATITAGGPLTFCVGSNVVLTATAGPGYSYQWYNGSVAIPGATNATYTATSSGGYSVVISVAGGCSSTATPIKVVAVPLPVVTTDNPTSFCWGSSALLYVNVGGLGLSGVTYQWQKDGTNISGATMSSYNAYLAGTYSCSVAMTGICGSSVPPPVTLVVFPLPDPIVSYSWGTFSTGSGYVSYQWYVDGLPISGATSATTTATENGTYYVEVSDSNGCVSNSDVYILTNLAVANINSAATSVSIFPNPASDRVYIHATVKVKAVVTTVDGKEVAKFAGDTADVSGLPSGLYMILVYDENDKLIKVQKLIKS
jgi:large repetitive protein